MSFATELLTLLRLRWFRRLLGTRLTSQLADGVFQFALASYVLFSPEKQSSAVRIAAAFAVLLLPYSVLGPFAGVLLDRWQRRQVLVWCNVLRPGMVLVVATLVATGHEGGLFFGAALAVLSVNRFFLAGLSASLPRVVDTPEHLVTANAVSPTCGTIAFTVGGGVGFVLHSAVQSTLPDLDPNPVLMVAAAVFYLCSALVARTMPVDLLGPERILDAAQTAAALRSVVIGLGEGARHVWQRRAAGHSLAAIAALRFCYGVFTVMILLLVRNLYNDPHAPEAGLASLAIVVGASAVGFFAAALVTPQAAHRFGTGGWIVICAAIGAVVTATFGAQFTEVTSVAWAFLLGIVTQGAKICTDTIVQRSIDDAYRGRVFSFYDVLFNASLVAAAAFAAVALPADGKSYFVLATMVVGYLITAVLYGRTLRQVPSPDVQLS